MEPVCNRDDINSKTYNKINGEHIEHIPEATVEYSPSYSARKEISHNDLVHQSLGNPTFFVNNSSRESQIELSKNYVFTNQTNNNNGTLDSSENVNHISGSVQLDILNTLTDIKETLTEIKRIITYKETPTLQLRCNSLKRKFPPKSLLDEEIGKFLNTWHRKYVCNYYAGDGCKFSKETCKRFHLELDDETIIEELRKIDNSKIIISSEIFENLIATCKNWNCKKNIHALTKHVEDICGITFEKNKKATIY